MKRNLFFYACFALVGIALLILSEFAFGEDYYNPKYFLEDYCTEITCPNPNEPDATCYQPGDDSFCTCECGVTYEYCQNVLVGPYCIKVGTHTETGECEDAIIDPNSSLKKQWCDFY